MRNDPFYLSKDKSLEASLGVLLVDGNFEDNIACFGFFVKFDKYYNLTYFSQELFFNVKITKNLKKVTSL